MTPKIQHSYAIKSCTGIETTPNLIECVWEANGMSQKSIKDAVPVSDNNNRHINITFIIGLGQRIVLYSPMKVGYCVRHILCSLFFDSLY